jgi:hypothetical protein
MTATDRANELAWAVQDGYNCLFHLRELRAASPLVSAAELEEWSEIFDRIQLTFAEIEVEVRAGRAQTSLQITSDLVRSFADLRAHLSTIAPGAQLPTTLLDLVDVAWSEFAKAVKNS